MGADTTRALSECSAFTSGGQKHPALPTPLRIVSDPQTRTAPGLMCFSGGGGGCVRWEGLIAAQENLDKREDNKGISIKSAAFIQPCFLMERHGSSDPRIYG